MLKIVLTGRGNCGKINRHSAEGKSVITKNFKKI